MTLVSNIIEMANNIDNKISFKTEINPESGKQTVSINEHSSFINSLYDTTKIMTEYIYEKDKLNERFMLITTDNEDDNYDTTEDDIFIDNFDNICMVLDEKFYTAAHNIAYKLSGITVQNRTDMMIHVINKIYKNSKNNTNIIKSIDLLLSGYYYDNESLVEKFNIFNEDPYDAGMFIVPRNRGYYHNMPIFGIANCMYKLRNPNKYPIFIRNYYKSIDLVPQPHIWCRCPCIECNNSWEKIHNELYPKIKTN